MFYKGDVIAGPEDSGGEQDDADGGGYKKDKGPMPKADCLRVRFEEGMRVHIAVVNKGLGPSVSGMKIGNRFGNSGNIRIFGL